MAEGNENSAECRRLVIGFLAFMFIWLTACIMADVVWQIEARAYSMCWGWVAGTFGLWISRIIAGR